MYSSAETDVIQATNKIIKLCKLPNRGNHNWKHESPVPYIWRYFSGQRMVKELGKKSTQMSLHLPCYTSSLYRQWLELMKQEKVAAQVRKGCSLVPAKQSWKQKLRTHLVSMCIKQRVQCWKPLGSRVWISLQTASSTTY